MTSIQDCYRIILKPVLTEKSTDEQARANVYRFEVAPAANKIEIKAAVERLFDVKVRKVRTQIRPGKPRRRGLTSYHTPARKIAIVALEEGHRIELM